MLRFILILCILPVAGCNMPSPGFRGIAPSRVVVDGSVFDVRINGNKAEAMRVNVQYAPRLGIIQQRAEQAMAEVSGCDVTRVTGDQALAFGSLKCGSGVRQPVLLVPPVATELVIECERVRGSGIKEVGQIRYDLECEPG